MKKNSRGFLLSEALIMSGVVLGVLVVMFLQFKSITRVYNRQSAYDSIDKLYIVNQLKQFLVSNSYICSMYTNFDEETNAMIINSNFFSNLNDKNTFNTLTGISNIKTVIFTYENLSHLKANRPNNIDEKFYDYIIYKNVRNLDNAFRLVVEFNDDTYASLLIEGDVCYEH